MAWKVKNEMPTGSATCSNGSGMGRPRRLVNAATLATKKP
jgi:hypothetical protein